MRFVGLVLVLGAVATIYFVGYRGMTVDQARARLAQLLNLPGLQTPSRSAGSAPAAGMAAA